MTAIIICTILVTAGLFHLYRLHQKYWKELDKLADQCSDSKTLMLVAEALAGDRLNKEALFFHSKAVKRMGQELKMREQYEAMGNVIELKRTHYTWGGKQTY